MIKDFEIRDNVKIPMRTYNITLTSQEIAYLGMSITLELLKTENPQESHLYPSQITDRALVESIMKKFTIIKKDIGFISK